MRYILLLSNDPQSGKVTIDAIKEVNSTIHITVANLGQKGIHAIKEIIRGRKCDLILVNLNPKWPDDLEILRFYHENRKKLTSNLLSIPVVVNPISKMDYDLSSLYDLGIASCLSTPNNPAVITQAINYWLFLNIHINNHPHVHKFRDMLNRLFGF